MNKYHQLGHKFTLVKYFYQLILRKFDLKLSFYIFQNFNTSVIVIIKYSRCITRMFFCKFVPADMFYFLFLFTYAHKYSRRNHDVMHTFMCTSVYVYVQEWKLSFARLFFFFLNNAYRIKKKNRVCSL